MLEEKSDALKSKNENRLSKFRISNQDMTMQMYKRHGEINKKHNIQQSNVEITKGILKEYRSLKREENSLR
jgi:hypothetical protein